MVPAHLAVATTMALLPQPRTPVGGSKAYLGCLSYPRDTVFQPRPSASMAGLEEARSGWRKVAGIVSVVRLGIGCFYLTGHPIQDCQKLRQGVSLGQDGERNARSAGYGILRQSDAGDVVQASQELDAQCIIRKRLVLFQILKRELDPSVGVHCQCETPACSMTGMNDPSLFPVPHQVRDAFFLAHSRMVERLRRILSGVFQQMCEERGFVPTHTAATRVFLALRFCGFAENTRNQCP